ncbi:MAG: hypothetical protein LBV54_00445 [Puniceicoccales bacterium]|jgi:alpha-tubulin suppressor-like RCC1 family protein|nr:hypothetical protein [Puniceicoccales bacterium]
MKTAVHSLITPASPLRMVCGHTIRRYAFLAAFTVFAFLFAAVPLIQAADAPSLKITAVAAAGTHSLFVTEDGRLWAMGWNEYGQLGDGIRNARHTPVPISVPR